MLLGAAVLLLDAGLLLAFAPSALGDVRRAGAALPLIALVVVPATLVHPHLAYLQGLVLFALLAFFMWGERVAPDRRGSVVLACAATGAIGMIIASGARPALAVDQLRGADQRVHAAHVERFDWTQRYGPLRWPRTGNDVLEVQATPKAWSGEYWKAENLDTFNGTGWIAGGANSGPQPPLSQRTIDRWTQTLTVTVRAMQTTQIIASGTAFQPPAHLSAPALPGSSAGTWTSSTRLATGDSYTIRVYAPHPSNSALAKSRRRLSARIRQSDLALTLPQAPSPGAARTDRVVPGLRLGGGSA